MVRGCPRSRAWMCHVMKPKYIIQEYSARNPADRRTTHARSAAHLTPSVDQSTPCSAPTQGRPASRQPALHIIPTNTDPRRVCTLHRPHSGPRVPCRLAASTKAATLVSGVTWSTPWPRLRMWRFPGPPALSMHDLTASSMTAGSSASNSAGSTLPCTATSGPSTRRACARSPFQSIERAVKSDFVVSSSSDGDEEYGVTMSFWCSMYDVPPLAKKMTGTSGCACRTAFATRSA
mmetsp:Transcript_9181/g.37706  ORF Transcript_9181/g.37706 Transcript_9181/m.37706 type:complete len:234 (+) Transcript_9181:629-1330(+)